MMITKPLEDCDYVEVSPLHWQPSSPKAWLAALVGYNLGDGNISQRTKGVVRNRTGSLLQASFYAQGETDVEDIARACMLAGLSDLPPQTLLKKGKTPRFDTYQCYLCGDAAAKLVTAGTFVGKKVMTAFVVPDWVLNGSDEVKRAFLAALWGAEGTTPTLNHKHDGTAMKIPKMPVLNMSKRIGVDGSGFFAGLQSLMKSLGVDTTVSVTERGENTTYSLYVSAGHANIRDFFTKVGFLFAEKKALNAWLWSHYLAAYLFSRNQLYSQIKALRDGGAGWNTIAKVVGCSKGKVYQVYHRGVKRSSWDFPKFSDWMAERWSPDRNLLRLKVVAKKVTDTKPCYNVRVDSHDHSYLVGDGINNFNSFETMSGRVYYPFDRHTHVGTYDFDPKNYIIVGQDFNVDPMSSIILQIKKELNEVWAVDEIVLNQSNTQETVEEIERRYFRLFPNRVVVFPDPAGGNRSSARGESDVQIFREKGISRVIFHKKHPFVSDRVNAVNSMLKSADGTVRLRIDARCKNLIAGLEQTIYKPGSRDVDKSQGTDHITDALGYPIEYMFPLRKLELIGVSR